MDIPLFKKLTQQFTLGNLGGADTTCKVKELSLGIMALNCQNAKNGRINAASINYGVLDKEIPLANTICLESYLTDNPESPFKTGNYENCTQHLDTDYIDRQLKT